MARSFIRSASAASILILLLTAASPAITYENITADAGRGFGSTWNRYAWGMAEFNGKLYVGTWNASMDYAGIAGAIMSGGVNFQDLFQGDTDILDFTGLMKSTGAEIWRWNGCAWIRVYKSPPEEQGIRKMLVHGNVLYAASANYQTGCKVLRTENGLDWVTMVGGPMGNPDNTSIRTLLSHGDKLYVGTENSATGGELWAYDAVAQTWDLKQVFPEDTAVAEIAVCNGMMFVGTWDFGDSYRLYCDGGNTNWHDVTPSFPGSNDLHNLGVMLLLPFKEHLYLGTVNYVDGFTLLRSQTPESSSSWDVITTNGMGDPDNAYTWAGAIWQDKLCIGTFNHGIRGGVLAPLPVVLDGRAKLLMSEDGWNWQVAMADGFGSPFTYGIRTMLVSESGDLICGTASNLMLPDPFNNPALADIDPQVIRRVLTAHLGEFEPCPYLERCGVPPCGKRAWIGCEVYVVSPNADGDSDDGCPDGDDGCPDGNDGFPDGDDGCPDGNNGFPDGDDGCIDDTCPDGGNSNGGSGPDQQIAVVPLTGDINGDGVVDMRDLVAIAVSWGRIMGETGFDSRCDLISDGCINVLDLLLLVYNWTAD